MLDQRVSIKQLKVRRIPKKHFEFYRGYYCACAVLIKQHGEGTEVEDLLKENYIPLDEMKRVGIDDHDIQMLMPVINEIERKRQLYS